MKHVDRAHVVNELPPAVAHAEVRRVLSLWDTDAIGAPPRMRASAGERSVNALAGAVADDRGGIWGGVKMYTADAGSGRGHTVLVSSPGGELTVVDAAELGALRTGAVSGVATETLHGPSRRIAMIGAGYQAAFQLNALRVGNPDAPIRIWSRMRESAEGLAHRLREQGAPDVAAAETIEEATEGADVITVLTRAAEPLLGLRHVEPGAHVNAAGSNSLARRELEEDLIESSRIVVDSRDQARLECGDLAPSLAAGRITWDEIAELGALVRFPAPSRRERRTLFESQGLGVLDVALAALVVRRMGRK